MTHRVGQIIDQVATLLAAVDVAMVFKHRALALSDSDQEVPALSVKMGEDRPTEDDGSSNLAFIDSIVMINVIALVREDDEETALTRLLDLRTEIHKVMMASDRTLGLTFIIDTRYAGAGEPEIEQQDRIAGRLETRWLVLYRMNITDPS